MSLRNNRLILQKSPVVTYYPSKYYNITGTIPTKHIFANGIMIADVQGTGTKAAIYYEHTDYLTGAGLVTDNSGKQAEVVDYYPYGDVRIDKTSSTFTEQRKFIGQEYDTDTGLDYLNARYYNSATGRFISEDRVFLNLGQVNSQDDKDKLTTILTDPQVLNSYNYARNNPLIYNDPDGQFPNLINIAKTAYNSIQNSVNSYITQRNALINSPEYQAKSIKAMRNGMIYLGTTKGGRDIQLDIIGSVAPIENIDNIAKDVFSHGSYGKHAIEQLEWGNPPISQSEFKNNLGNTLENYDVKARVQKDLPEGRTAGKIYYGNTKSGEILIRNTESGKSTFFIPKYESVVDYIRSQVNGDIKIRGWSK